MAVRVVAMTQRQWLSFLKKTWGEITNMGGYLVLYFSISGWSQIRLRGDAWHPHGRHLPRSSRISRRNEPG